MATSTVPAPNSPFAMVYLPTQSAASTITGPWLRVDNHHGITLQTLWTGTLTGTFSVEGTNDPDPVNAVLLGTSTVTVTATITSPAGSGGNGIIVLNDVNPTWVRLKYTASSGAGNLTVGASGRTV